MYKETIKTAEKKRWTDPFRNSEGSEHAARRRANPQILDKITVDYYGTPTPLNQVGNISSPGRACS